MREIILPTLQSEIVVHINEWVGVPMRQSLSNRSVTILSASLEDLSAFEFLLVGEDKLERHWSGKREG